MQLFMQESRRRDELDRVRRDEENRRKEEERERREQERERREEASRARDDRLFAALRENRPMVPAHNPNLKVELPRMKEGDELE